MTGLVRSLTPFFFGSEILTWVCVICSFVFGVIWIISEIGLRILKKKAAKKKAGERGDQHDRAGAPGADRSAS